MHTFWQTLGTRLLRHLSPTVRPEGAGHMQEEINVRLTANTMPRMECKSQSVCHFNDAEEGFK